MIEYVIEDRKYGLSYQELKEKHYELCRLMDEDFVKRLPEALHLACVICWLKEIPSYVCLCDMGIIHEIAHLLHIPKDGTTNIREIRKLFEEQLKLS